MNIRPARVDDIEAIASFTTDTFEWGDYVPESLEEWLKDDADSVVLVATNPSDDPIGLVRVVMTSPDEAWFHAARVHPDARRQGIAMTATEAAKRWASDRGAKVARLMTESWNTAAQTQVAKAGFREVSTWFYAVRSIGSMQPNPTGNGGTRVPGPERLIPTPSAEAQPAYLSWSGSDLLRHSRGLFPTGWHFRTFRLQDLEQAAREHRLWGCPAGWAIGAYEGESFHVSWMAANPDDSYPLARALLDRATDLEAEKLTALVPAVDHLELAFSRIGAELHHDMIWEFSL